MTVVYDGLPPITLLVIALFFVSLVAAVVSHVRAPSRRTAAAVVVFAVGFAATSGVYGYAAYHAHGLDHTWTFGYRVDMRGNGTGPESLIVPAPEDETLLAGLERISGSTNWSFVDTPHGRGLFVRFTGSATLQTLVTKFPPPATSSAARPTMIASTNCTAPPSNCTGLPRLWMFYSGTAGVWVSFSMPSWYIGAYPATGWATYESWPPAVPGV